MAGISTNTGRFHLRFAFAKTEARGQADLVRIGFLAMTGG
jgi:DNA-binding CsgD family transcriptional regulator